MTAIYGVRARDGTMTPLVWIRLNLAPVSGFRFPVLCIRFQSTVNTVLFRDGESCFSRQVSVCRSGQLRCTYPCVLPDEWLGKRNFGRSQTVPGESQSASPCPDVMDFNDHYKSRRGRIWQSQSDKRKGERV